MHTWKPDAYREAPSPAGVLMAVGMLNGALVLPPAHPPRSPKAALGPEFSGGCCWRWASLSVAVATPFILIQWNLKRLLAYSSIEHVGIMAVGLGLGAEAATFGALLHMTYHTLAKPRRVLLGGDARAAPQLLGLRRDRPGARSAARPWRARSSCSPR